MWLGLSEFTRKFPFTLYFPGVSFYNMETLVQVIFVATKLEHKKPFITTKPQLRYSLQVLGCASPSMLHFSLTCCFHLAIWLWYIFNNNVGWLNPNLRLSLTFQFRFQHHHPQPGTFQNFIYYYVSPRFPQNMSQTFILHCFYEKWLWRICFFCLSALLVRFSAFSISVLHLIPAVCST